jgi:hypothetical protein
MGRDAPFIIWTLQRTGSTNLYRCLMYLSSHRTAESEGFDPKSPERQFSWVVDDPERAEELRRIAGQRWNMKHVVDRLPAEFNASLALATTRAGYHHVILDRRDAAARVASLAIAERHGTWDPGERTTRLLGEIGSGTLEVDLNADQLTRRQRRAQAMLDEVRDVLHGCSTSWCEVAFEDLYAGPVSERLAAFGEVAAHVGVDWAFDVARVGHLLAQGGQNTGAALPAIPGARGLREALAAD